ncbi:MAG: hypothetical protein KBE23_09155 [Chloroflexi bacterium]|nr:hypothetical protein [Chloroflexota bacterium]MBP7042899.1 hypothetical protein [Chloroflexota bacterium]
MRKAPSAAIGVGWKMNVSRAMVSMAPLFKKRWLNGAQIRCISPWIHLCCGINIASFASRLFTADALVPLALAKPQGVKGTWLIVSDQPPDVKTFDEYGLRFDIGENFLDDMSNGFQLESSLLRSVATLNRFCLVLSMATIVVLPSFLQTSKPSPTSLPRKHQNFCRHQNALPEKGGANGRSHFQLSRRSPKPSQPCRPQKPAAFCQSPENHAQKLPKWRTDQCMA